jgi:hypothetical protein
MANLSLSKKSSGEFKSGGAKFPVRAISRRQLR